MFTWMNRRVYHWLRLWLKVIGVMAVFGLIGAAYLFLLTYVDAIWGGRGIVALIAGTLFTALSALWAWFASEDDYKDEVREQERVEKSLKRDWTR